MSGRRDRVARLARLAGETEARARAQWIEADHRVKQVDRRREHTLTRTGTLAGPGVPIGLRSHVVDAGARHLMALTEQKVGLADEAQQRRAEFDEALVTVRSLDRLVQRLDDAEQQRRRRREAADLQDAMAVRAARGRS